jgi:hypothetical protein
VSGNFFCALEAAVEPLPLIVTEIHRETEFKQLNEEPFQIPTLLVRSYDLI